MIGEPRRQMAVVLEDVVPFVVMVIMEGCTIGLTIWAKTVMSDHGMSPFVFVIYTNALASVIFLPYSFLFHRHTRHEEEASVTPGLVVRFFFMGLTGYLPFLFHRLYQSQKSQFIVTTGVHEEVTLTQYFIFVGLDYSSPILVCAMGHLVPTFSFLFALILRNIKLDLKNRSIQVKMLGTFITVAGAVFVTLYKGHVVRKSSVLLFHVEQRLFIFASTPEHWVIGGILLAGASFSVSIWNIIQLGTLKHYPQVMKVVFFCSLIGTFQCTIISLAFERDLGAWKPRLNTELLLIILTAIFGGVIRSHVQIWCMQLKGPLYATTFKPFGIIYASFFGITFFGNSIYYGSIMGAVIMGIGYYVLVWGPIRDEVIPQDQEERNGDLLEAKVPLLQGDSQVYYILLVSS